MGEDVLETEAYEIDAVTGEAQEAAARPLPVEAPASELSVWRGEVRSAAIAAAGGLVAGAATAVVVRASRAAGGRRPARRGGRKERPVKVLASRSFMVDVHLLDR